MGWLRRINNIPTVLFKHTALIGGQPTLGVVQYQTRAQRRKRRINMDRIGVTRKVHRMHPVVGEMPAQPFDAFKVGGKPMLDHQIATKTQHISRIKQVQMAQKSRVGMPVT